MASLALSQTPVQTVERLDPALDHLVDPNVAIERVATGFGWTEGPVWTRSGMLLFAAIYANNIMEWRPGGEPKVFIHPSGYTGTAPFKGREPGSDGMTLDSKGRLTVAGHARRNVWRLESLDPNAQVTVLADTYQGKRLNSPNDVVYRSDGSLYFTDPPYGMENAERSGSEERTDVQRCIQDCGCARPEAWSAAGQGEAATPDQRPAAA